VAGAGAQSYNSAGAGAGAGDEKPEFAQHYWCPNTRLGCQFPMRNTKWLKNGKFRKAILSAFYNISKRNFGILLILWCSFKLWWNFCLDQNFSYKGKGPLNLYDCPIENKFIHVPFALFIFLNLLQSCVNMILKWTQLVCNLKYEIFKPRAN
jgi:hypothetical protein